MDTMTRLELAASILNCAPGDILSHRETDDGGIVVIDPVGRKLTFSAAALEFAKKYPPQENAIKSPSGGQPVAKKPASIATPAATPIAKAGPKISKPVAKHQRPLRSVRLPRKSPKLKAES